MKKLKQSRTASFVVLLLVYAIATFVGVALYNLLNCDWWLALLIADVLATVVTFIFSLIFDNASVYDPYWSVQPLVILIAFATTTKLTLFGVLILVVVGIWGTRLTTNWAYTFNGLMHQDWRYTLFSKT